MLVGDGVCGGVRAELALSFSDQQGALREMALDCAAVCGRQGAQNAKASWDPEGAGTLCKRMQMSTCHGVRDSLCSAGLRAAAATCRCSRGTKKESFLS